MNPKQRLTLRALGIATVLLASLALGLLGWEGYALTLSAQATISEVIWILWAAQPGPIALVGATLAFWLGVLCGHFFWQSKRVYAEIEHRADGACCNPAPARCCENEGRVGHAPHQA